MHGVMVSLRGKNSASTRIWKMIDDAKWTELRQLLLEEGRIEMLPSPKQRRYHPWAACREPLLPYCLASGAPEDIVRVVLNVDEHRQVLSIPDKLGRLPLHIACHNHACKLLIADLVSAFPRAAVVQDNDGNLPLHYAVLVACGRQMTTKTKNRLNYTARTRTETPLTSSDSISLPPPTLQKNTTCNRDRLQIINDLLVAAPTSVLIVNNELDTPLSLAVRLENGYGGTSENTPAYNIISSVATTVMHDWERQQMITEDRINEMNGLFDESFLERRKPVILSTSSVVRHFILGR